MKTRLVALVGASFVVMACGSSPKPAVEPPPPAPAAPAPAPAAPAPAPAPAPVEPVEPVASADAGAASPAVPPEPQVVTEGVSAVSNEITTPSVVSPDKVIAELRGRLNACYQDGLKKDPKLVGSVTLSAKIDPSGKVSAVTPKLIEGLTPAVIKCLSETVKSARFAAAGGMSYATSIDIPVRFATN